MSERRGSRLQQRVPAGRLGRQPHLQLYFCSSEVLISTLPWPPGLPVQGGRGAACKGACNSQHVEPGAAPARRAAAETALSARWPAGAAPIPRAPVCDLTATSSLCSHTARRRLRSALLRLWASSSALHLLSWCHSCCELLIASLQLLIASLRSLSSRAFSCFSDLLSARSSTSSSPEVSLIFLQRRNRAKPRRRWTPGMQMGLGQHPRQRPRQRQRLPAGTAPQPRHQTPKRVGQPLSPPALPLPPLGCIQHRRRPGWSPRTWVYGVNSARYAGAAVAGAVGLAGSWPLERCPREQEAAF